MALYIVPSPWLCALKRKLVLSLPPPHTHIHRSFLSKWAKLIARAERAFISPYLQHINVSIAEVDVEDFGQRDSRTQYSCKWVGEVRSGIVHVAKT